MHPPAESPRAEDVIAYAAALWDAPCARCDRRLLGQEAVLSLLLGLRDTPQCFDCLAAAHGAERGPFLARALQNLRRLDCYRAGWAYSDARLAAAGPWPEARLPRALRLDDPQEPMSDDPTERTEDAPAGDSEPFESGSFEDNPFLGSSDRFDAGDMGCGELVLALRVRLGALPAGATLHVTATDLGAPEDLPAWCRLTGHRLVRAEHPEYLIARRSD